VDDFIRGLPKVELHMHIEGSLEPALMFELAERNGIGLRFGSVDELRAARRFEDLESFLALYYEGASVLIEEQDFFDLTWAYLLRADQDNVRHTEVFFDPQTHTDRGVPFETVISGIRRGLEAGYRKLGISSHLIMCFVRDLDQARAMDTLEQALPYQDQIIGVGLDSSERGHPPSDFLQVFERARREGFRVVAHAGEEGPPEYVRQALDLLGAARIDHGVRAIEDPALVQRLAAERVPLTVCPLSNVRLRVFPSMAEHSLKRLLDAGVVVTVNSDDPAYFGGYLTDNYLAARRSLGLTRGDICQIAANGCEAAFLDDQQSSVMRAELDEYLASHA
jgi:adenosine deaminase